MSDFKVVHNNLWKRPIAVGANDLGTWKPVRTEYVNDAGVWKPVWTAPGAQIILSATTFTVPPGVFSICVAVISEGKPGSNGGPVMAGGNGGDGGSIAYKNNIAVTPGDTFSVYNVAGQVNFGTLYVLNGRDGVSAGWDVSYLGGPGGAGQSGYDFGIIGFPGGEGGQAATWIVAGRAGGDAPGGASWATGGVGVDLYGVVRSQSTGNGAGNRAVQADGAAGQTFGGGGGGGMGQAYPGSPVATYGGAGGPGAVRIIWGNGKSFPDNANF